MEPAQSYAVARGYPRRIAIVGCGAIAELAHLPALASHGISPTALIETDTARHAALEARWGAPAFADLEAGLAHFDSAIVAIPHYAHRPVCEILLEAGKDVLLEKPLAVTSKDARQLVGCETRSRGSIAVGYMRRYLEANIWVRDLIRSGELGRVRSVDLEEGAPDAWEAATPTHLTRASAGGGVLIGVGVHSLDLLAWWLGELTLLAYRDDSLGGLEAEAEITLDASGSEVRLLISRLRTLRNTVVLEFERGTIEVHLHANTVRRAPTLPTALRPRLSPQGFNDLFTSQLMHWFTQLDGGPRTMPSAAEGAETVSLVESCYSRRTDLRQPWDLHATLTVV